MILLILVPNYRSVEEKPEEQDLTWLWITIPIAIALVIVLGFFLLNPIVCQIPLC